MSPPLVPRPAPIFIDLPQLGLGQTAGLLNDLQQADAARAIPTSPSGAHTLNDRFNQLGELTIVGQELSAAVSEY